MSTNPQKTELISGLVKKRPFNFPATSQVNQLWSDMRLAMNAFARMSRRVLRVEGLSQPEPIAHPLLAEAKCIRAINAAIQLLTDHPVLHGTNFTILDGTSWADVREVKMFGLDISFINVFWNGDNPVLAIMLGQRKFIKGHTQHHIEAESQRYCVFYEHSGELNGPEAISRLRDSILASTNYHQLSKYGTIVAKAMAQVTNPESEYPVAAACFLDGVIWYGDRPARHHHILHSTEYQEALKGRDVNPEGEVQGFLTNHGNFVTRYRAMYMALRHQQIIETNGAAVEITRLEAKQYRVTDPAMGGIWQVEDQHDRGYRIGVTGLFSEDLF